MLFLHHVNMNHQVSHPYKTKAKLQFCIVRAFNPGRSQLNLRWIWSSSPVEIMIVRYVHVSQTRRHLSHLPQCNCNHVSSHVSQRSTTKARPVIFNRYVFRLQANFQKLAISIYPLAVDMTPHNHSDNGQIYFVSDVHRFSGQPLPVYCQPVVQ
jgi:hypothetical protein